MKKSFSLIELLISLIIISLIVRAFAPLITKKLKANDVTVGSFGAVNNFVTKEYCDKFNALYIPKEKNDGIKPVCVTKYNVGDMGIPIADGVQVLNVGETCTDSGNCCWQGHTAGTGTDECTDDGNYDGCTRTVCQWIAANSSCNFYAPEGTKAGMWRLPKKIEMDGWVNNLDTLLYYQGADGLMLCDCIPKKDSARCWYRANGCLGTDESGCDAAIVWSSTEASPGKYYSKHLHFGITYSDVFTPTYAFSTRCVLDNIPKESKEPEIKTKEPSGQPDCDKYNALFIDKSMNGGKTNVCAMKYNIGDIYTNPEVRVVSVGTTCLGKYCCWQGKTSGNCTDTGNGSSKTYSGCNRTVCNWDASNISCNTYAPDGIKGLWRLPTKEEMDGWANNISELNNNKGTMGLMLCDFSTSEAGSVHCWYLKDGCPGSADNYCDTSYVWSFTEASSGVYYNRNMGMGVFSPNQHSHTHAFSARCVTDKIPVK